MTINSQRPVRSGFEPTGTSDSLEETPNSAMVLPTQGDVDVETSHKIAQVPRLCRFDSRPPEATALALDISARSTILMSSIFLGPALLELATQTVQETCQEQVDPETCLEEGRIYGFRPTSLLSNIGVMSGLVGSIAMPAFGATVDHTTFRWQMGAISAFGLVLVKGAEVVVSSHTWFIVAWLQVLSSALFQMHITTTYAYTSELSNDPAEQTSYNTYYVQILYLFAILFLGFVTVVATLLDQGDVGAARISQLTTSSFSAIIFCYAWTNLFQHRPAKHRIPEGQTLLTVGFYKNYNTFGRIARELPALKWMIFAVMFGEAGTNTLITIATTYMKSFLEMDASAIGVVMLVVLCGGAPGSKLGAWISYQWGPVVSATICNIFLVLSTALAAVTLTGPEHSRYMPCIGALWGIGLGWLLPMHSTAFITIGPSGQDAEKMGLYIFSGQVLSWLPPMVFTAINEAGMDMAYGLASLDLFFGAAIFCLLMVVAKLKDGKEVLQMSGHDDNSSDEFSELKDMSGDGLARRRNSPKELAIT